MKLKPLFLIGFLLLALIGVFKIQLVKGAEIQISLTLLDDAMVKSSVPNTNFGSHQFLHALNATTGNQEVYGYTKFNLSEIPASAVIINATLYIYAHSQPSAAWANITAKEVSNQTWQEGDITWNDSPSVGGVIDYDFTASIGYWDWNVTAWVNSEYGDTEANVSFSHVNNHQVFAGWTGAHFRSQDYSPNTYPPQLNVTYEIIGPDEITPLYLYPFGLNSTLNGSVCQFTVNFSDNTGLTNAFLSWNNSGIWANVTYTLSGTVDLALWNQTLNATSGYRIEYLFYVNDTANNWNTTVQHFIYTNTKPIVLVVSDASILFIGALLLFSLFGGIFILGRRNR